jgi:hypothetical protein
MFGPGRSTNLFVASALTSTSPTRKTSWIFLFAPTLGLASALQGKQPSRLEVAMLFLLAGAIAVFGFAAVCLFLSTALLLPR